MGVHDTSPETGESFDLATILKATRAISSELDLDRLAPRIVAIIVENVGARLGHLVLDRLRRGARQHGLHDHERELDAGHPWEVSEFLTIAEFFGEEVDLSRPAEWRRKWAGLRRRLVQAIRAGRHDGDPELHANLLRWIAWRLRETDPRILEASGTEIGESEAD